MLCGQELPLLPAPTIAAAANVRDSLPDRQLASFVDEDIAFRVLAAANRPD